MKKYLFTKIVEAEKTKVGVITSETDELGNKITKIVNRREAMLIYNPQGTDRIVELDDFYENYKCIDTFEERLQLEVDELKDKLDKLQSFITSPNFDTVVKDSLQRDLLVKQAEYMLAYLTTVKNRIALLNSK